MTLRVRLVAPEGEVWSGEADRVIATTLDGDIGVLTGHTPVLGVLREGSLVRILPEPGGTWVQAAVASGFLSVNDDNVAVLSRQAVLGQDVDIVMTRMELQNALDAAAERPDPALDSQIRYLEAALLAAGQDQGAGAAVGR